MVLAELLVVLDHLYFEVFFVGLLEFLVLGLYSLLVVVQCLLVDLLDLADLWVVIGEYVHWHPGFPSCS